MREGLPTAHGGGRCGGLDGAGGEECPVRCLHTLCAHVCKEQCFGARGNAFAQPWNTRGGCPARFARRCPSTAKKRNHANVLNFEKRSRKNWSVERGRQRKLAEVCPTCTQKVWPGTSPGSQDPGPEDIMKFSKSYIVRNINVKKTKRTNAYQTF